MTLAISTLAKPTLYTLLVAGGSHTAATTRYYTAHYFNVTSQTAKTMQSPWSTEVSATFDAVNKSVAFFVDPDPTDALAGSLHIGRAETAGTDYTQNNTANFARLASTTTPYTRALLGVGSTTVDQDSAAAGSTLFTASTLNFIANDWILIDAGGAKEEFAQVSAVTAGISITLVGVLTNTHLAVDSATVWEAIDIDDNAI